MSDDTPHRVLLVAAEETLRDLIGEMLRSCGCRAEYARDGREALRRARAESFDLILTDDQLPGLDGPSLHHALRVHAPDQAHRIAFITRLDPEAPPLRAFLERARCLAIQWPFDSRRLHAFVRELLPIGA